MRQRVVQDRITHVSESVYSALTHPRKASIAIAALKEMAFVHTVIYCRPPEDFLLDELQAHVKKEWDSDSHFQNVVKNASVLIRLYDCIIDVVALYTIVHRYDRTKPGDMDKILRITGELKDV